MAKKQWVWGARAKAARDGGGKRGTEALFAAVSRCPIGLCGHEGERSRHEESCRAGTCRAAHLEPGPALLFCK